MNDLMTILIVDDTASNIDIMLEHLDGYDILVAMNGMTALEIARHEKLDLILLDIMMPEMDGYEICHRLKEMPETADIPVIFITSKTDEESIERAYDVGGIDYVTKPFKPKELRARIKTQLELKSLIRHLEYISSHDMMTGIYNRRKFFELMEPIFELEPGFSVMMIDIDNFKSINDRYGHPVGDRVIKEVAATINSCLDARAIFGRLGGEEFAVICMEVDMEILQKKVEFIRRTVEAREVLLEDGSVIHVTISNGIALKSSDTLSMDALLKAADEALYQAKNSGRNRTVFRS